MKILIFLLIAFSITKATAQTTIAAKDAAKHINENVTICDKVYSARHFEGATALTLLNLGGEHPNELLTLVIKGDDLKKFSTPPDEAFKNKIICVTGLLIDYKGKPEIVVNGPDQIKINQ